MDDLFEKKNKKLSFVGVINLIFFQIQKLNLISFPKWKKYNYYYYLMTITFCTEEKSLKNMG